MLGIDSRIVIIVTSGSHEGLRENLPSAIHQVVSRVQISDENSRQCRSWNNFKNVLNDFEYIHEDGVKCFILVYFGNDEPARTLNK